MFLTIISNSVSCKSLLFIRIRTVSDLYFFFFIWNTVLCLFNFPHSLCWFCTLDKIATSPSLERVISDWRWDSPISSAWVLDCFSKFVGFFQPHSLFLVPPSSWRCSRAHQCPKGESHSQHMEVRWLEAGKVCSQTPFKDKLLIGRPSNLV